MSASTKTRPPLTQLQKKSSEPVNGISAVVVVPHGTVKPAVVAKPLDVNEVAPGLFVGDENSSRNRDFLITNKIGLVISLYESLPWVEIEGIDRLFFKIDDTIQSAPEMVGVFDAAIPIMTAAAAAGKNILVHCHAGISRSVTVAIAYLCKTTGRSVDDVLDSIVRARSKAYPNLGFCCILKQLFSPRENFHPP